jgi:mycothiol synthase
MDSDASLDFRSLTPTAAGPLAALMAAIAVADSDDEVFGEEDLLEEFSNPDLDFDLGSIGAYDGDVLAGYSLLTARRAADEQHDMRQEGGVHPDYRGAGLGSQLLDWSERAAVPLHLKRFPGRPLSLNGSCLTTNEPALKLYADRHYQQTRWFHLMECELPEEIAVSQAPAGIEIAAFNADRSADAHLIRDEAFGDHWGSTLMPADAWDRSVEQRHFRSAYSFVAYASNEPAGLIIGHEYDAYNEWAGKRDLYIAIVATRRPWRGQGLASSLIGRALAAARTDGFQSASLTVDADSPTGAVGIYERLGFAIKSTTVTHRKHLPT